jgi:hypothetical protein
LPASFAGVRPADAGGFVIGQFIGALAAWLAAALLIGQSERMPVLITGSNADDARDPSGGPRQSDLKARATPRKR